MISCPKAASCTLHSFNASMPATHLSFNPNGRPARRSKISWCLLCIDISSMDRVDFWLLLVLLQSPVSPVGHPLRNPRWIHPYRRAQERLKMTKTRPIKTSTKTPNGNQRTLLTRLVMGNWQRKTRPLSIKSVAVYCDSGHDKMHRFHSEIVNLMVVRL